MEKELADVGAFRILWPANRYPAPEIRSSSTTWRGISSASHEIGFRFQAKQRGADQAGLDAAFAADHKRAIEFAQDAPSDRLVQFRK